MSLCILNTVSRTFRGAQTVHALNDLTLRIDPGEFMAVEGPSGSGKSTLLNILGLLDRPTSGDYRFDGVLTGDLSKRQLADHRARLIGFVFQSFHLLTHLPVLDNVALAGAYQGISVTDRYEQAFRSLQRLGVDGRVTARVDTLSGGERQRVAVARALLGDKQLLLCDEPTGNLDRENTLAFLDILDERVAEGVTVVVATHDPKVAARASRRCLIVDGRLQEL